LEVTLTRFVAVRNENCLRCGFCRDYTACALKTFGCIGCGACVIACPQGARQLKVRNDAGRAIQFTLDGTTCSVKGPVSVFDALCELGQATKTHNPDECRIQALCGTGGCWSCSVSINGVLTRSCVTPLQEGMAIVTDPRALQQLGPVRLVTVMRPAPHYHPSIFVHGCNYRCSLCHNWDLTFAANVEPKSPAETVGLLDLSPETDYWVGISGGEPTLSQPWLLETIRELRRAVPNSRIQLDTNASLLTPELIDAVVAAGITDISPDLKALHLETFMKVTGVACEKSARLYLQTSWNAVRYISERYRQQVFMAVSLPCHPRIHSKAELYDSCAALAQIDPEMRVTLIELQPAFRQRDWPFLGEKVMEQARTIVESAGLRNVVIQGGKGIPRAKDPLDLPLSAEDF
jgi:pyruvate formate lyase activating enzyme